MRKKEPTSKHLLILGVEDNLVHVQCKCGKQFYLARSRVSYQRSCGCLKSRAISRIQQKQELLKRIRSVMNESIGNNERIEDVVKRKLGLTENDQVIVRHLKEILYEDYKVNLYDRDINNYIRTNKRIRKIISILAEKPNTHGLKLEHYLSERLNVPVSRINSDLRLIKQEMNDTQGNFFVPWTGTRWHKHQSDLQDRSVEDLQSVIFNRKSNL